MSNIPCGLVSLAMRARTSTSFVVCGLPVAQPRQRHAVRGGGQVVNYTPGSSPVASYKAACRLEAGRHCAQPLVGPVALWLTFIFPRPKSRTSKRGPNPRLWKQAKPDIDNLIKSTCDALNGVAWRDDAQVAWCCVQKLDGTPDESARVEVRIAMLHQG